MAIVGSIRHAPSEFDTRFLEQSCEVRQLTDMEDGDSFFRVLVYLKTSEVSSPER